MTEPQSTQLTTDDAMYVNEATLELLRLRLEAGVRNSFLKTVTIPIGGGGVIALIIAIVLWIPARIDNFLQQPGVQDRIASNVNDHIDAYFRAPEHQREIEEKIDEQTSEQIKIEVAQRLPEHVEPKVAEIVTNYFGQKRGQVLVERALPAALKDESIRELLMTNVSAYLATPEGQDLLINEINRVIKPASERVSERIIENQERLVAEVEPQLLHGQPKESIDALRDFLRPDNVREIAASNRALVLTKTVRRGNRYAEFAIVEYLEKLYGSFGEQFRYVAVLYVADNNADEVLVGLIPRGQFETFFRGHGDEVVELLNSGNNDNRPAVSDVRSQLERWFGMDCTRVVSVRSEVGKVLRDGRIWPRPMNSRERVAVVDEQEQLIGITSRHRLIAGLLID